MKTLKLLFALFVCTFLFSQCTYDFIIPEEIPVIDPDDPNAEVISFSNAIVPIFTTNNNCTSCHDTGGQIPDLTAANAYSALNSTRYINSDNPAESRIYTVPHPDQSGHSQKKYTAAQAALVLGWIQQGAKNN